MTMLDDPILDAKMIKDAEKKLERQLVQYIGSGAVSTASHRYKRKINEVKHEEARVTSKLDSLSSKIDTAIKGKWSKKVQAVSKKEIEKITRI
ncbi:hypothetical protein [Fructilactobacillus carniphilus]|uniref:Uncharacterized protein n=1 Tax=Fructilactobacillus carniphilus TaxID=2940297 RepID=A0ABY5BVN4_9LACO|nr:hypothetical protein [Fructilactobacillus carniphilus]USS90564.1 hypothetical protein M3M37_06950 [Fructilactobacillus carniphilus]